MSERDGEGPAKWEPGDIVFLVIVILFIGLPLIRVAIEKLIEVTR